MEFGENGKPCEENETRADCPNFLSKQLSKCKELNSTISEHKRSLYDFESSISMLQVSTSLKQIKYNELEKREDRLRQKTIEAAKAADALEEEFKKSISERVCHNFWERLTNNAEYFLSAYTEYSSTKLLKDIEWYKQEFEKMQHEFSMRIKELECLEVENGLNSSISDGQAKEKLEIDALLNDIMLNNSKNTDKKVQKIRIAQQTSTELKDELNRKRTAQKYI
ncbi:uncharacterized protein LOC143355124 [Halictus rubicundus]|uniref:uncharacterized protein LOC143355124 n=1 Tax=Halictus rubicundus TaxID=77578 RepID=UPI0040354B5B